MLLEALTHFWRNLFIGPADPAFQHITGEAYWKYRQQVEGAFFAVTCLGLVVWSFLPTTAPHVGFVIAQGALALTVLAIFEMRRLARLLREQVEFAYLFYG